MKANTGKTTHLFQYHMILDSIFGICQLCYSVISCIIFYTNSTHKSFKLENYRMVGGFYHWPRIIPLAVEILAIIIVIAVVTRNKTYTPSIMIKINLVSVVVQNMILAWYGSFIKFWELTNLIVFCIILLPVWIYVCVINNLYYYNITTLKRMILGVGIVEIILIGICIFDYVNQEHLDELNKAIKKELIKNCMLVLIALLSIVVLVLQNYILNLCLKSNTTKKPILFWCFVTTSILLIVTVFVFTFWFVLLKPSKTSNRNLLICLRFLESSINISWVFWLGIRQRHFGSTEKKHCSIIRDIELFSFKNPKSQKLLDSAKKSIDKQKNQKKYPPLAAKLSESANKTVDTKSTSPIIETCSS